MARKQTVQGIIYDGIRLLPTEAVPPRKVLLGWMVEVDTLERVNLSNTGKRLKPSNRFMYNHLLSLSCC
ncbi:hypothetical protein NXW27_16875 [Phocaeicola dorei]|nr:hypothetical protein [Phocaeicola dorei]